MISRIEFYVCITILMIVLLVSSISKWDIADSDRKKGQLEALDSIYQVQRDSAFARALKFELKADSIQSVLNRKNLDLNIIRKKTENEKKNVLILSADSSLSLFERSVTH